MADFSESVVLSHGVACICDVYSRIDTRELGCPHHAHLDHFDSVQDTQQDFAQQGLIQGYACSGGRISARYRDDASMMGWISLAQPVSYTCNSSRKPNKRLAVGSGGEGGSATAASRIESGSAV